MVNAFGMRPDARHLVVGGGVVDLGQRQGDLDELRWARVYGLHLLSFFIVEPQLVLVFQICPILIWFRIWFTMALRTICRGVALRRPAAAGSCRLLRAGQQFRKVVVYACDTEIRFAPEGPAHVMDTVLAAVQKLH